MRLVFIILVVNLLQSDIHVFLLVGLPNDLERGKWYNVSRDCCRTVINLKNQQRKEVDAWRAIAEELEKIELWTKDQ